ncbi:RAB6A-GEF complex partner protein 2-like [Actinia tenebrosa]|uniref:RAB6A-GEF complex partner protein 2-like n=1 Tax=Actinia tenebrosa TaxID=6105 RepID=A0A6P8H0A1_ACTTE|nr:RAB6A-GEF complex partner protein 2-like [Actinia tenebrosa]
MIEVKARMVRSAVYLAGETLQCEIIFTNVNEDSTALKNSKEEKKEPKVERLAWASVQIHCQCSVNSSRIVIPQKNDTSTVDLTSPVVLKSSTSFAPSRGEQGQCLMDTQPKILFCDLELAPGESRTFLYSEIIPADGPPSFKGYAVKYSYKVTLGTSRVNSQFKLLRLPLRVLTVRGLTETENFFGLPEQTSNPFLENKANNNSLLDIAVDYLTAVTSKRNSHVYNIVSNKGHVGKFCLFKSAYRIGEEIVGSFDFTDTLIPCVKYTVTLQSEEHIPEEYRPPHCKNSGAIYTSYCSVQEYCLHAKKTHLVLPVPVTVCPEFESDLVCLKWRLHFEFVLASGVLPAGASPLQSTYPQLDTATWQGPADIETEIMTWDFPVKLLATNPLQASSISMIRTSNSMMF